MGTRFTDAIGRKIISQTSAERVGVVSGLMIDVAQRRVSSIAAGKGRKARLVAWRDLSGFGPDAVIVSADSVLRAPLSNETKGAIDGTFELIGKRALGTDGNIIGTIRDAEFDPTSASLEWLVVDDNDIPARQLVGLGSYAAVIAVQ